MPPGVLFMLRHCQSVANLAAKQPVEGVDQCPPALYPLSKKGEGDARQLGQSLGRMYKLGECDYGFVSPMLRAMQTAELLDLEVPFTQVPALRERSWGELEGIGRKGHPKRYPKVFQKMDKDPFFTPFPGGESLATVYDRLLVFYERSIVPRSVRDRALIVGHGESLLILRAIIERAPVSEINLWLARGSREVLGNGELWMYSRLHDSGSYDLRTRLFFDFPDLEDKTDDQYGLASLVESNTFHPTMTTMGLHTEVQRLRSFSSGWLSPVT
jgi:broad specificity phosphatase PhoE